MKHVIAAIVLAGITLTTCLAHANASMICREENRGGDQVTVCYTEEVFEEMQRAERAAPRHSLEDCERVRDMYRRILERYPDQDPYLLRGVLDLDIICRNY